MKEAGISINLVKLTLEQKCTVLHCTYLKKYNNTKLKDDVQKYKIKCYYPQFQCKHRLNELCMMRSTTLAQNIMDLYCSKIKTSWIAGGERM